MDAEVVDYGLEALIDIYPAKHVEIVNSKSRKYKMQQRLGAVPRAYRLVR